MNDRVQSWLQIGHLCEELGEWKDAAAAFQKAIDEGPDVVFGYSRLATLLKEKTPDQVIDRLFEHFVACSGVQAARAYYATAVWFDAMGDYAHAADQLLLAKHEDAENNKYNSALHRKHVKDLISGYSTSWFDTTWRCGSSSEKPVFIVGLPRSGTTLVEQILCSHPDVHGAGELDFGYRSSPRPKTVLESVNREWILNVADAHLAALDRLGAGKRFVVDKMPDNYLHLGWLATLYPAGKFVEVLRDPRDTALSAFLTDFKVIKWTRTAADIGDRFAAYEELMEHWGWTLPVDVLQVQYENLVADQEGETRRLLSFLGLPWDDGCLNFHENRRPVKTASLAQVRRPMYATSVGRWENYADHLPELFKAVTDDSAHRSADRHSLQPGLPGEPGGD